MDLSATNDIVVLSPPGMIRASHVASSAAVRISLKAQRLVIMSLEARICAACLSSCTCSLNAPCRARTPTVTSTLGDIESEFTLVELERGCQRRGFETL